MKITLISTNGNVNLKDPRYLSYTEEEKIKDIVNQLVVYCGRVGRKCYSPLSWEEIEAEPEQKGLDRAKMCLENKHHSIYDHAELTFAMSEIPKFLLMILNNEYCYTTSEQSARWTDFSEAGKTERERTLYKKWSKKIREAIVKVYGDKFTDKEAIKLGQENARYMISVFVETSIIYKMSLRQLNNILHYMEKFMSSDWENQSEIHKAFMKMLKPYLEEFIQKMAPYRIEGLIPKSPRELAIFKDVHGKENIYDTVYKLSYELSFAAYAQAHRHRTIRYSINFTENSGEDLGFYVPEIVREVGLSDKWLKDIQSIKDVFPQGMKVWVVENGEINDFVSKCYERCCGRAQLEIQKSTNINLERFRIHGTEQVKKIIERDIGEGTAACTFPYHKCTEGCKFGAKQFYRKI